MKKESFLPSKYKDLAGSRPVERAVEKKVRGGEKGANTREGRIEVYLERLESITKDPRGFELFKYKFLKEYVTRPEDIPESYWKAQEKEARNRGESADWAQATEEQREQAKCEHAKVVLHDQRASLEQWIDYFGSSDADHIPKDIKYWIFRNILKLQELIKVKDKDGNEHIKFNKRSKGTVKPFPDINYEALGYVVDAVIKKLKGNEIDFEHDIQEDERQKFLKALNKTDFAKLYAWANELHNPVPEHLLPITEGKWVKYKQGSDPQGLVQTIRGKGTGWCTAGLNTAKTQLQSGDFYVYYTLDDDNNPTIPRIAIRMDGSSAIAEDPRGIAYKQNLDPYMLPILDEKLQEFGSVGEVYKKKSTDMKRLTEIADKVTEGEELNKDDLRFLYEMDSKIEGFGNQKDPRIQEILQSRPPKEDIAFVLDISPEQVSLTEEEALSGNILFHYGDLNLSSLTTAEGLKLPESISGHLYLNSLTTAEGLTLPETVGYSLDLRSLTTAEGLTLPETVGGNLDLSKLTTAEGLKLPKSVGGVLDLSKLTTAEGLKLPETVGNHLYLDRLTTAEGLTLPKTIGGRLFLDSLTTAEGLILPESVSGSIYLLLNLPSLEKESLKSKYPNLNIR